MHLRSLFVPQKDDIKAVSILHVAHGPIHQF